MNDLALIKRIRLGPISQNHSVDMKKRKKPGVVSATPGLATPAKASCRCYIRNGEKPGLPAWLEPGLNQGSGDIIATIRPLELSAIRFENAMHTPHGSKPRDCAFSRCKAVWFPSIFASDLVMICRTLEATSGRRCTRWQSQPSA